MRGSRMAAEESAAAFKNPRLDLRWLFIGKPSLVGVDPEAFHRTFRMVWMLRLITGGLVKCPSLFEGVSRILVYLNDEAQSGISDSGRQHHRNDRCDRGWLVLAQGAFQRVGALEGIGAGNFHLPAIASFRTQDHDPPVTRTVRHDVLDPCDQVTLQRRVAGILGFDCY